MASYSKIQWTHHTFNPWRGCTKVSAGCANCYAETFSHRNPRTLGVWGPNGKRVLASPNAWRQPLKWNKEAQAAGERHRVFCASLADIFEDWRGGEDGDGAMTCHRTGEELSINDAGHVWPAGWPSLSDGDDWGIRTYTMKDARERLFDLITATPNLNWLLLTKRPEIANTQLPWLSGGQVGKRIRDGRNADDLLPAAPSLPNIWLGVSVENRATLDSRAMTLSGIPAAVRFWSVEPLLEDLGNIRGYLEQNVDWVIVGGESGGGSRECNVEWVRSIVRQCRDVGVPVFVKQLGAHVTTDLGAEDDGWPDGSIADPDRLINAETQNCSLLGRVRLNDRKGGDPAEWPEDLRVREFPEGVLQ